MNLVSYEYVACQNETHGVLVLSEFAGSAQSLNGAIIVNPWNTQEMSEAIFESLTMNDVDKKSNFEKMHNIVSKYTSAYWGSTFIKELQRVGEQFDPRKLPKLPKNQIVQQFQNAKGNKIIFLDYDGTLTSTHKLAVFAKPASSVLSLLSKLSLLPNVFVYIISGRSRTHLDKWFAETGVGLSAEHGCFYRHPKKLPSDFGHGDDLCSWPKTHNYQEDDSIANDHEIRRLSKGWFMLIDSVDSSYRQVVLPLLQHYTDRTPGSFIEEKEINLTYFLLI